MNAPVKPIPPLVAYYASLPKTGPINFNFTDDELRILDATGGNLDALDPLNGVPTLAEEARAEFRYHVRNQEFSVDELILFGEGKLNV